MAIDRRSGTKVSKEFRAEAAAAKRVDPYPYIGIVKNNLDPTRTGRLQVWIPDFGGDPEKETNWRTVSHASPFMGTTETPANASTSINQFNYVPHTYGMWMVPPDIGVQVIVLFIGGDPLKGYWVACVNPDISRHMMPGMAGSNDYDKNQLKDPTIGSKVQTKDKGIAYPVAEFNKFSSASYSSLDSVTNQPKPIHEPQMEILLQQGLDSDNSRGAISSSSQRESPSNVFGISTPGRPLEDPKDNERIRQAILNGSYNENAYRTANRVRKGGHQFVLDDGSVLGKDQLVRLRTATGHQVLMHDSESFIYIAHADGTSWIELTAEGAINIYAENSFNVRSKGAINFHSDTNINLNAANSINLKAGNKIKVESSKTEMLQSNFKLEALQAVEFKSGGAFNVDAATAISIRSDKTVNIEGTNGTHTDSGGTKQLTGIDPFNSFTYSDTAQTNGIWTVKEAAISSIATKVPTHEPYPRGGSLQFYNAEPVTPNEAPTAPGDLTAWNETTDRTKEISGTPGKLALEKDLRNHIIDAPLTTCQIGPLTSDQLTAFWAQMAKTESGGRYDAVNPVTYFVGKYQFGYEALKDQGYVTSDCSSNKKLAISSYWTGKDNIKSLNDWFSAKAVQEAAVCEYTRRNYVTLASKKIGVITSEMTAEQVAGLLAVSWFGPGYVKPWRLGRIPSPDQYGNNRDQYYQNGKYAISVLASKVPGIRAG